MDYYSNKNQRVEEASRGNAVSLAIGFLIGLSAALAVNSYSQSGLELQVEGGKCKYGLAKDGTFYQSDRMTNNELSPTCGSIALAGKFDEVRGWRIAYMSLGTITARDNHATQWDEEAFSPLTQPCDPVTKRGCTMVMHGQGRTYGLSFSLTKRWPVEAPLIGGLDVIGEAGLFFFRSRFNAVGIRDEDGSYSEVSESSGFTKPPAPLLGVGLRKGPLYVIYRHAWTLDHRALSLTDHSWSQLMAGVAVPL